MDNSLAKDLVKELMTTNKRLFVVVILLIVGWASTTCYFIWDAAQWIYEDEVEVIEYQYEVDADDGNAVINTGSGGVEINGESKVDKNSIKTQGENEKGSDESKTKKEVNDE